MGRVISIARLGLAVLVGAALVGQLRAQEGQLSLAAFKQRASKLATVVGTVVHGPEGSGGKAEPDAAPLSIRPPSTEAPLEGDRFGTYLPEMRKFVVDLRRPASVDDALFAMTYSKLVQGFGEPATPWFARGIAHALVASAGGLALSKIEGRTEEVTPEEILEGSGRPAVTLAPGEARLARCLMGELKIGIAEAWKVNVDEQPSLTEDLIAAWNRSLGISRISPILAYPRSVGAGKYVVLGDALLDAGLKAQASELRRIVGLGAHGVEIPMEVELNGSTGGRARRLIETALLARTSGLSVVLAPRFTPPLAPAMTAGPEAVEAYGQRRAEAVETLSWLAEFAKADGLVLFNDAELGDPENVEVSPEVQAARRSLRRQSLVGSRPFVGDRLAFASTESRLQSARSEGSSHGFSGALAVINLKVGLVDELPSLGFARVGTWDLTEDTEGLRGRSDEALRKIFQPPKGQ